MTRGLAGLTEVPSEPIPLSVLTGFLGSGKTTLLSRVLNVPDLSDTAVLISEFGMDARRTIRAAAAGVNLMNHRGQVRIGDRAC